MPEALPLSERLALHHWTLETTPLPEFLRIARESGWDAVELRRRVTSPNVTTHAAIETFEAGGFRDLVRRAVHAAAVRGKELSDAND